MSINPERWRRIGELFDELVELEPAACKQRLEHLEQTDAELAREVRALLAADSKSGSMLDSDAAGAFPELLAGSVQTSRAQSVIGPYRLLRVLGEGGMGEVWLGERVDGSFEQQVAIKLLKRGMDSNAILRRFLQERRILARLNHPNIVHLLDGGMSADGQPYYVMELVEGEQINEHANRRQFSVAARVELIVQIAEALSHAHAQLIVHRDLKPSNVLIDKAGEPRVLDFGIAKLLEESGNQTRTGTGLRVMSPAYAAPEQLLGEPIGTRTDIYSLGLLLYEMLLGELPVHRQVATPAQLSLEVAKDTTTRISVAAQNLPADRLESMYGAQFDARQLARELGGDLEIILGKALQRDPARRFASATEFANDLRNWLQGKPITARADSAGYRLRKFVQRHRLGVAAATLAVISLVAGLGIAMWQAGVARNEAARADAARRVAEQQLARTERVKQFILALFRETDPVARASAKARTPIELIRAGIADVDTAFKDQPELQAELRRDLGEIQTGLDDPAAAKETLKRAWEQQKQLSGADSVASAEAQAAYGDAVYMAGDVGAATPLLKGAIELLKASGVGESPKAAQAEASLALIELIGARKDEALRLARHALEVDRASYGSDSLEAATRLATVGKILQETGSYDDALTAYREALEITVARGGKDHARTAMLHTFIADVLRVQRHYAQALPEYEEAVRIERMQLPPGHSILGSTLLRLGDLQRRTQRFDEADRSLAEAISILAPAASGQYAQALQMYGNLAREQGRPELAAQRYAESVAAFRKVTGDSMYTGLTALLRVQPLIDIGKLDVADTAAREALDILAKIPQDEYASFYQASVLGDLRHEQGRYAEAIRERRTCVVGLDKMYGKQHAETIQSRILLASSLIAEGDVAQRSEAAALLDEAGHLLGQSDDPNVESMLGLISLEQARLRYAAGDRIGAQTSLDDALKRLAAKPADVRHLRAARAFARRIKEQG